MEENRSESVVETSSRSRSGPGWTTSPLFKLVTLGVLVLVMLIPVAKLLGLIRERQARSESVRTEVAATWGDDQTVGAAVLTIPYRYAGPTGPVVRQVHVLPQTVHWQGNATPRVRYRGIFDAVVYEARLHAEGTFGPLDLGSLGLRGSEILWDRATLSVGVADLAGIQQRVAIAWNGVERSSVPGSASPGLLPAGLHADLPGESLQETDGAGTFTFDLSLRGAERLLFLPLGESTTVALSSVWPDPAFSGASLPRTRKISAQGFSAEWEVPYFGRGYPQSWHAGELSTENLREEATRSAFGVDFVQPVDHYRLVERSTKYAILFIVLTFTTIFLLEVISPVRLHPVQYLLVGFALCLFYLLLLSLSEHLGFGISYAVASIATVILISLYGRSLLHSWRRTAPLGLSLTVLYGYLYSLLQAESLSLVMGSGGLFAILALVMYLTRNLDWWTLTLSRQTGDPP